MTPETWIWLVGGVVLFLLLWTLWTLTRLRRLLGRVAGARTVLETQLRRRAGLAEELAREHRAALGEALADRLAAAAADVRAPRTGDRELAENELGRVLRDLPDELPGVPAALQSDLAGTSVRVALARRFYNDAVRDTRELRHRRLPRLLRLHASRPLPRYFDIDDRVGGRISDVGRAGQPSR